MSNTNANTNLRSFKGARPDMWESKVQVVASLGSWGFFCSLEGVNEVLHVHLQSENVFELRGLTILVIAGGGVVTTRAHVHYIVTEYGIAYLFGKNIRQRAHELIRIAHPDHREALETAAFERLKCMPSPDWCMRKGGGQEYLSLNLQSSSLLRKIPRVSVTLHTKARRKNRALRDILRFPNESLIAGHPHF